MINEKKALDNAFAAALFLIFYSILIKILSKATFDYVFVLEIILFIIFSYFTKQGNKNASIALLTLFIIDRVLYAINIIQIINIYFSPIGLIFSFLFTIILWHYFYRAFLAIKTIEDKS